MYSNLKIDDQTIVQNVLSLIETHPLNEDTICGALFVFAKWYEGKGDLAQAQHLYLRALHPATNSMSSPVMLDTLADLYTDLGNYTKAETFMEQSLHCLETPQAMIRLAETYHKLGKIEEAEAMYLRALDTYTSPTYNSHASQLIPGQLCSELRDFYADTGHFPEAEKWHMEALKVAKDPAELEQASRIMAALGKLTTSLSILVLRGPGTQWVEDVEAVE